MDLPLQGKVICAVAVARADGTATRLLTTAPAETTCPKPCTATGVSRDDPDSDSKGGAEQKEGAAVERREARPLRISLRRGRDAEGGCRARSAEGGDADCVARNLPSASRRSAPVVLGEQFVSCLWPQSGRVNTARARTRRENAVFCPHAAGVSN